MMSEELHDVDPAHCRQALVSKGGQVSIPADIRRRWQVDRLLLVDHGDHVTLRPLPADGLSAAKGSLPLPGGLTSERLRASARAEDAEAERRRSRR